MKKLFLLAALLLCMCVGAIAQAKVVYDGPIGIDWKFRRSFTQGNILFVDFVVENNTSHDFPEFGAAYSGWDSAASNSYGITAYDDEGNMYDYDTQRHINAKNGNQYNFNRVALPKGNMIKVRIRIDGIDEYATIIKTFIIPVYHPGLDRLGIPGFSKLTVTNIPIPRE